ncbi:RAB5B protein, partial [Edolisoma coerulescens]|nr:RAB5B protein [Edolisoma coerulescens]
MSSRGAQRPNGHSQPSKICQFKLVLLGESAVGKSSLVLRFVKGQFHEYQESTIGGDWVKELQGSQGGSGGLRGLSGDLRGVPGISGVSEGSQGIWGGVSGAHPPPQETFARTRSWVKELQRQASPSIVIALAGNKADLASKRMVEYE